VAGAGCVGAPAPTSFLHGEENEKEE
jgi:hypothetical protein